MAQLGKGKNGNGLRPAKPKWPPVDARTIPPSPPATEREINEGKPEHLRRLYCIKKYSNKGNGYAAKEILCREDALKELQRLAANHIKAGRTVTVPPTLQGSDRIAIIDTSALVDSFMVDEGSKKRPLVVEYKIV